MHPAPRVSTIQSTALCRATWGQGREGLEHTQVIRPSTLDRVFNIGDKFMTLMMKKPPLLSHIVPVCKMKRDKSERSRGDVAGKLLSGGGGL